MLLKVKINPFFWLIVIGAIATGQFIEIITLFGIVIIHELGHIFTAKSYGWKIIEIQLLPFGGMAKVEQPNDSRLEEFVVAIAGPLQNLMMILVTMGLERLQMWSNEWATFFMEANLWIGLFNLLPISPLDGEKLMKVFFYLIFPFRKALTISLFISFVLAILLLFYSTGYWNHWKLNMNGIVLSIFFLYQNWIEVKQVPFYFWQFLLRKAQASPKRNTSAVPLIVKEDTPVLHSLYLLKKERYHLFYVLSNQGQILRILPEEKLLSIVFQKKDLYQPIGKITD
ncbi:stage IV sporulation protein FB [Tepidibacillus fermentans]|uniref:Stage IV sporulation protein FB n=1 Tax=Tepidibacillus fermentans TaxID=1281767 RepID=A0A4R3K889_9BACI|nr:stage IV sporulation protein FB [Tepidibacillus fermentans]